MDLTQRILALAMVLVITMIVPIKTPMISNAISNNLPSSEVISKAAKFYSNHYGVTAEEAKKRFNLEDLARTMQVELENNEPETFAGLWIQNDPTFRIKVQFTRDGESTIREYMPKALADYIEIRTVKESLNELKNDQAEISVKGPGILSESYIDIMNDCIQVNIAKANRYKFEHALQNNKLAVPSSVKINYIDRLPIPTTDFYGGLSINGRLWKENTSGFAVKYRDGTPGILAAGHSNDPINYWWNGIYRYLSTQYTLFEGDYDVKWLTCPGFVIKNLIQIDLTGLTTNISSSVPYNRQLVGEMVEKYGAVTGDTYGLIYSKNYAPSYVPNAKPSFVLVYNVFGYPSLSLPGDSGSPWYEGSKAYGIMSGSGNDGQFAIFMPIDRISAMDVTLMTSYP